MDRSSRFRQVLFGAALLAVAALAAPACGGGGGGPGPDGAGQGLVLVNFLQGGQDNVPLNRVLEFTFSEPVNKDTILLDDDPNDPNDVPNDGMGKGTGSIQIRKGSAFGLTAPGIFEVQGSTVRFWPQLAGLCSGADAGLLADTLYRVIVVGAPEEFAIQNTKGQPLDRTSSFEFRTRDVDLYEDQIPGVSPVVVQSTPTDGTPAVAVEAGNEVEIEFTENLAPCTVNDSTVVVHIYELGDKDTYLPAPGGRATGFDSVTDADPDPTSWGSGNSTPLAPPQRLSVDIQLVQDFWETRILLRPLPASYGRWPDNALIVVGLSFEIRDYGGLSLPPTRIAFTTENLTEQAASMDFHFEGEAYAPLNTELTTADVDTARAPSLAQGYVLFSGDGDNGFLLNVPSLPETPLSGCTFPRQPNDGSKDVFDPTFNTTLDTGASNTCENRTDGSTAVVWEFASFRIRNGVTVTIVGMNPAIILVQGSVVIEPTGRLTVAGGRGANGRSIRQSSAWPGAAGGRAVAGGGDGGDSTQTESGQYGGDGFAGFGSPDHDPGMTPGGSGQGGLGGGEGNSPARNASSSGNSSGPAGGGGGHAAPGTDGQELMAGNTSAILPLRGDGGGVYPTEPDANKMYTPSAGSGAGAAGYSDYSTSSFKGYDSTGGAGGAGGGFVDITAQGDITILGTIDASGGDGGQGGNGFYTGAGGGGGGSGGGIRLLTPNAISVSGATLRASGGSGGRGPRPTYSPQGTDNYGGDGGSGRIVMEAKDAVVLGLEQATIDPGVGAEGYYQGSLDITRFKGGGLEPQVVSELILAGPLVPTYEAPVQDYGLGNTDFIAGITTPNRGLLATSILVEAQGYPVLRDGTPDTANPTGWHTLGYFRHSGAETLPEWIGGANPTDGVPIPPDNVTTEPGMAYLNPAGGLNAASTFIQFRITFFLPLGIGVFDPGPYVDLWTLRYRYAGDL